MNADTYALVRCVFVSVHWEILTNNFNFIGYVLFKKIYVCLEKARGLDTLRRVYLTAQLIGE